MTYIHYGTFYDELVAELLGPPGKGFTQMMIGITIWKVRC